MRRWSIALFRLAGIRLELHATFGLLLVAAAWAGAHYGGLLGAPWHHALWSVGFTLLVFTCVVLHELGHCLVARRFGVQVPRIVLLPIGGMAQFDRIPREPGREIAIAFGGPAVNWVIAGLLYGCVGWPDDAALSAFRWRDLPAALLVANLALGTFNLLPAYPMDGGRILRALLAWKLPYLSATRWAVRSGQVIAAAGVAFALWRQQPLLVLLFAAIAWYAETEFAEVRTEELLRGLRAGDVARRDFVALPADAPISAAITRLRETSPQDVVLLAPDARPAALLTRERLLRAAHAGRWNDRSDAHAETALAPIDVTAPLVPDVIAVLRESGETLVVVDAGRLVGVIERTHLETAARLHRHGAAHARPAEK